MYFVRIIWNNHNMRDIKKNDNKYGYVECVGMPPNDGYQENDENMFY